VVGEDVGGDFVFGKLLEDPDEVFPWINPAAAAAFDEGAAGSVRRGLRRGLRRGQSQITDIDGEF
jgi:hypothetical protein